MNIFNTIKIIRHNNKINNKFFNIRKIKYPLQLILLNLFLKVFKVIINSPYFMKIQRNY